MGLKELNEFYLLFPEDIKKQGVMKFAVYPPKDTKFFVTQLWDRHVPGWRRQKVFSEQERAVAHSFLTAKIQEAVNGPSIPMNKMRSDSKENGLLIQRPFKKRKGSLLQAPENFPARKNE